MTDIALRAAYGSVVEDEGQVFIGFAEGEDEDENYVLFRQSLHGGPIWMEVGDDCFGADDAVEAAQLDGKGLTLLIRPDRRAALGFARSIRVEIGPDCEDAAPTLAALHAILGDLWKGEVPDHPPG